MSRNPAFIPPSEWAEGSAEANASLERARGWIRPMERRGEPVGMIGANLLRVAADLDVFASKRPGAAGEAFLYRHVGRIVRLVEAVTDPTNQGAVSEVWEPPYYVED